jgi:uncharacterized OB-fold protein
MIIDRAKLEDISAPYFEHCAKGELAAPKCNACGKFFFYATVLCPHCHSADWDWQATQGRGAVYSFTTVHRSFDPKAKTPYVIGIVELEPENIRVMTNLINVAPEDVTIGMPVQATFGTGDFDDRTVALFEPVA